MNFVGDVTDEIEMTVQELASLCTCQLNVDVKVDEIFEALDLCQDLGLMLVSADRQWVKIFEKEGVSEDGEE